MNRTQKKWTPKEIGYLETNLDLLDSEIGEFLGRSIYSIRGKRKLLGYKKYNAAVKHSINTDFFKEWTTEMAYILGFIFADGCIRIRKSGSALTITQKDSAILEMINECMKSTYPVKKENSSNIHRLSIYRKEIVADLIKRGVKQRKSKNMLFPNVPEKYFWHFLRGYFDGDGSASISRQFLTIQISSGSIRFIKTLKSILEKKYKIPCSINKSVNSSCFNLSILAKMKRIFFIKLYEEATIFLGSKYIILNNFFEKIDQVDKRCKKCSKIIGNHMTRKKYCDECSRIAILESYRRYDIKRGRRRL